jgi:hypothetical protein
MSEVQYAPDPRRWGMACIITILLTLSVGGLGLTGASVDSARTKYNASYATFNAVYYMSYVDFLIGMAVTWWLMTEWGLYVVVCVASVAQIVGFSVQSAYQYSFWPLIIGGMIVDSTRAFIWFIVPIFVTRWFEASRMSIVYGLIFFIASLLALGVVAAVRFSVTTAAEYNDNILWFIVAFLAASLGVALAAFFWFAERPTQPPGPQSKPLRSLFTKPHWPVLNRVALIITVVVYVISVGTVWSFTNLSLSIMDNHSYSNDDITLVALVGFVTAIPTSVVIGTLQSLTRQYHWITFAVMVSVAGVYTAIPFVIETRNAFIGLTAVFQFLTGGYSLTFITLATELAYPVHESHVTFIMLSCAQISGLLQTLLASFDVTFQASMWVSLSILWGCAITFGVAILVCQWTYLRARTPETKRKDAFTASRREEDARDYTIAGMTVYPYESGTTTTLSGASPTDEFGGPGSG